MKLSHIRYAFVAILALVAISAFAGHPLVSPDLLAGAGALGFAPFMLGEISPVDEIKTLIENQGRAWEEFKKTNDELIKAKADGKSIADLQAKLDKIQTDMTEQRQAFEAYEAKANRPGAGGGTNTEQKAAERKAFDKFLRTGDDSEIKEMQRKAMNSYSDPNGGVLVLEEMDSVIDRVVPTISAMFRLANNVTIGSQKYTKLVKKSGMAMAWVANGGTNGETTEPTYAEIEIEAFPGEIEPWVHNETLQDAFIDLEADLANEAAIGFAEGAGAAFITGNGVGRPRGITSYTPVANSAYAWGSVGYIASGKSAAFTSSAPADKIVTLQHALKAQYRPGAVWLMNDSTLGTARQMKDGSGTYYLWQPDPAGAFGGRFLGNPVEVDDNMPDIGAGAYAVAFGNFKRGYTVVNRAGTTLIRDNITAKGKTKFNFRRRFGGGIVNFEAIKLMKFATS